MFKIGDLAVYPAHGVGIIERIESQEFSGASQDFYVMRILENDMIIMIPTQNVDSVGLRGIIGRKEVPKLYSILEKRDVVIDIHDQVDGFEVDPSKDHSVQGFN